MEEDDDIDEDEDDEDDGDDEDDEDDGDEDNGGHQQLQSRQLLLVLLLLSDAEPGQRIDKKCYQNSCGDRATKEDAHDDVDLVDVYIEVLIEQLRPLLRGRLWVLASTILTSANQHLLVREVGVGALGEDGGGDEVAEDPVALEEEEEDAEEADDYRLGVGTLQLGKPGKWLIRLTSDHLWIKILPVSHLGKIGALGRPHGSSPQTKDYCCRKKCVELRVELRGDVGGVAGDADHQGPLHRQLLDHDGGDEHAGEDQGRVEDGLRACAQSIHLMRTMRMMVIN